MADHLATFPVVGNAAVRAVRVPCLPENVPYLVQQGDRALAPTLGLAVLLPPLGAPTFDDPIHDPETADLADQEAHA